MLLSPPPSLENVSSTRTRSLIAEMGIAGFNVQEGNQSSILTALLDFGNVTTVEQQCFTGRAICMVDELKYQETFIYIYKEENAYTISCTVEKSQSGAMDINRNPGRF